MTLRVAGCVAVLFLSFAGPVSGQRLLSGVDVGGHIGFNASNGDIDGGSIGGRQHWVTVIVYPASRWWYLGVGITNFGMTTDVPLESRTFILEDPQTGTMTQTGVVLPIGRLSLFGEMQILNPFTPDKGLTALFFTGFNFTL